MRPGSRWPIMQRCRLLMAYNAAVPAFRRQLSATFLNGPGAGYDRLTASCGSGYALGAARVQFH